jgi:hypothetical protein
MSLQPTPCNTTMSRSMRYREGGACPMWSAAFPVLPGQRRCGGRISIHVEANYPLFACSYRSVTLMTFQDAPPRRDLAFHDTTTKVEVSCGARNCNATVSAQKRFSLYSYQSFRLQSREQYPHEH